jgi:hypothetical protein
MLCLPYCVYFFSPTKLEIRAEQVLPGSKVRRAKKVGEWGKGEK